MANKNHLAWLTQGVGAWNQWRDEHPVICPGSPRVRVSVAQAIPKEAGLAIEAGSRQIRDR
jgi:hypothetical protein